MADLFDDPDYYEDITVPVGCDLVWGFQLEPWDATGTTAVFNVGASSFPMVVGTSSDGPDAVASFTIDITPAQMAALGLNVVGAYLPYVVLWTASTGAVSQLGRGVILAA